MTPQSQNAICLKLFDDGQWYDIPKLLNVEPTRRYIVNLRLTT